MIVLAILAFIFGLGLIILIHELGHFIFAKKAGILCYEFSIGMGLALYRKKKGETTYAIRCIPIGGYVSMAGEQVADSLIKVGDNVGLNFSEGKISEIVLDLNEECECRGEVVSFDLYDALGNGLFVQIKDGEEEKTFEAFPDACYVMAGGNEKNRQWRRMQISSYERSFESKKLLPRFLTISFGPIMNFLLAIVLCFIVGLAIGKPDYSKTVIGEISGPASLVVNEETKETKLMKNDEILSIDGVSVSTWNELSNRLDELVGKEEITFEVKRKDETIEVKINPMVFVGNLGVYGTANAGSEIGVPVNLYITNAEKAGIKNNDYIRSVDGQEVTSWSQIITICENISEARRVEVVLDRPEFDDNGNVVYVDGVIQYKEKGKVVTVEFFEDKVLNGIGVEKISQRIGISPKCHTNFLFALQYSFTGMWDSVVSVFNTLGLLFSSSQVGVSDLSGPVGIFSMIESSVSQGFVDYLALLAMLSVNIGIVNLLPIPALDGGRLVFLAYEGITRKKPNKKFENILNSIVFILLMILFVYVTFNDILRLG